MLQFNLFGIPVTVQPFFWLTMLILGSGGGSGPQALLHTALFMLAGFISILVHELGHALTARRFGARCHIVLQAFGGYAAYSGIAASRKQQLCITAAGPALQGLAGLLVFIALHSTPQLQDNARYFLTMLVAISWIWAAFNLLPIVPLDGGRLLESALGPHRITTTLWVSIITATLVSAAALIGMHGMNRVLIPAFMLQFAWQAWKALPQNRWK